MNLAYLHLVLNHMPIIGIPFTLLLFIVGYVRKNEGMIRFSCLVASAIALITLPVYFTGEPAEKLVEHLPGVSESLIESHEEAAEISLILVLIVGVLGAVKGLVKNFKFSQIVAALFFVGLIASAASLAYTGKLGGEIRHTEVRANGLNPASGEIQKGEEKDDDD